MSFEPFVYIVNFFKLKEITKEALSLTLTLQILSVQLYLRRFAIEGCAVSGSRNK